MTKIKVREYIFCCTKCSRLSRYAFYPSEAPTRIDCDCGKIFWWSRKLEKMFDAETKEELTTGNIEFHREFEVDSPEKESC